jgi:hypothetical protein
VHSGSSIILSLIFTQKKRNESLKPPDSAHSCSEIA